MLDTRGRLRKPDQVFFRDLVSLAQGLGRGVHDRLIDRPEGGGIQSRLRSYVMPADASRSAFDQGSDGDEAVERAGVEAVLRYERERGREAEEMPPMHPGFDVRSVDTDGTVRVIEFKSTADAWGPRGVAMSSRQFTTAQQRREEFWLYVVDQALTAPRVHPINDPATKVEQ